MDPQSRVGRLSTNEPPTSRSRSAGNGEISLAIRNNRTVPELANNTDNERTEIPNNTRGPSNRGAGITRSRTRATNVRTTNTRAPNNIATNTRFADNRPPNSRASNNRATRTRTISDRAAKVKNPQDDTERGHSPYIGSSHDDSLNPALRNDFSADMQNSGQNYQGNVFNIRGNGGSINFNQSQGQAHIETKGPFFIVPFSQDPDYVQRGDILEQVQEKLDLPAARVALVGLGGIGKSQLAIQYCYQSRRGCPGKSVFWVHASTSAKFEEGFRSIATRLKLLNPNNPQDTVLEVLYDWLSDETNGEWIMVIDNADDKQVFSSIASSSGSRTLAEFLPEVEHGRFIFTSRNRDLAYSLTGNSIIQVAVMQEHEGMQLISKKLHHEPAEDMKRLLIALDYIPLAITQAAAYIHRKQSHGSINNYLELFNKNKDILLTKRLGDRWRPQDAENSIILTWQISFRHVQNERPSSTDLLAFLSCFNHQSIPEFALQKYYQLQNLNDGDGDYDLDEDLALLQGYSFISSELGRKAFEMHHLVQLCTQQWLKSGHDIQDIRNKFLQTMASVFPIGEFENRDICAALYPHIESMILNRPSNEALWDDWSLLLTNVGGYLLRIGNFSTANILLEKAVSMRKELFGMNHEATISSGEVLGLLFSSQGKYPEAEKMHREAVQLREKVLGNDHPHTLTSMNNLAIALNNQGQYTESEKMFREVFKLRERILGKEHLDTLASMNDLAAALQGQGQYPEAEKMHQDALRLRKRLLGQEHPSTLMSMDNLASLLSFQGKYQESEKMHREVLQLYERVLGKEHPDTLMSMTNLASVLNNQGNYKEAENMYRETLQLCERVLGKEHPGTLKNVHWIAYVLYQQGKYAEAVAFFERAHTGFVATLGPDHPITIVCSKNHSSTKELLAK